MPCYTVSKATIKLKAENFDLLREALKNDTVEELSISSESSVSIVGDCGLYTYEIRKTGEVIVDSLVATEVANAINRSYSREVIRKASRKFGWTLKAEGNSSFVAEKRGL
jgi:hypothetical protein